MHILKQCAVCLLVAAAILAAAVTRAEMAAIILRAMQLPEKTPAIAGILGTGSDGRLDEPDEPEQPELPAISVFDPAAVMENGAEVAANGTRTVSLVEQSMVRNVKGTFLGTALYDQAAYFCGKRKDRFRHCTQQGRPGGAGDPDRGCTAAKRQPLEGGGRREASSGQLQCSRPEPLS